MSKLVVIGNPGNRRVTMFQAALEKLGLPLAQVIAWRDLARDPSALAALPDEPTLLRIDSFGEDFEVERAFLRRGFDERPHVDPDRIIPQRGRILAPRQHHLGFLRVLREIEAVIATKTSWRVLNPPSVIAELFDKAATARTFAALEVPVPPFFEAGADLNALRARLDAGNERSVFVKLTCGSSASCLALWTRSPRESLITSMELTDRGMYNSLRLRKYGDRAQIDEILRFLLAEGAHVERALRKARVDGRFFDCRVLVVAGEPAFTVVRTSPHPITNLHLGGRRGLLPTMPAGIEEQAMTSCRTIAKHYGALHVGIDVMYDAALSGHRVLEANAFGDLLPNLERDGLSVYEWEIRAATA